MLYKHRINILPSQIKESVDRYFKNKVVIKSTLPIKPIYLSSKET
jgi:hypothetical protein